MSIKKIVSNIQPISHYLFWALICITTALLLMEHSGPAIGFPHMDKIVHVIIFFTLTAVGYLAYPAAGSKLYFGLMIYGILTEVLQGVLTVTRYASVYDWLADTLGIFLCLFLIKLNTTQKIFHVR